MNFTTIQLLTDGMIDIETNFIDGLEVFWMVTDET
jgi:hypothetical protein